MLAVPLNLVMHIATGQGAVGGKVDAVEADALAYAVGDDRDGLGHAAILEQPGCCPRKLSTASALPPRLSIITVVMFSVT